MTLPIASLSVEIFASILDVVESPRDMVSLACTCSTLAHLTRGALRRHRETFENFRYASDRDPSAIISLVRHLVLRRDPVVGKYFRSFDVWGARLSWDEWRHFEVSEQGVKLREGESLTADQFSPGEHRQLLEVAQNILGDEELRDAREELQNGGDGLLKMLIIASAPRLESLTFIRRNDLLHKSCQAWLFKAIQRHLPANKGVQSFAEPQWPRGLHAICNLAVGVDAGMADESIEVVDAELRAPWEGQDELAAMMRLPSLTSLYYHTGPFPEEDEDDWESDEDGDDDANSLMDEDQVVLEDVQGKTEPVMPKQSSTVKQLYLDMVRGAYTDMSPFYTKLIAMPRALESFSLRWARGEYTPANILGALGLYQEHSLQKMMFYNPGSMVGYRCSCYRPEDVPSAPLTMWWQCAEDVELQALYDGNGDPATRKDVVNAFRACIAGKKPEVIIFDGELSGYHIDDNKSKWSYYEDGLLAILKEAGSTTLKALFIDFPKENNSDDEDPGSDGEAEIPGGLPKVVALAQELGVDLYGSKLLKTPKRHVLDFPMAPSKWDLVTGPYFGKRIEQGFISYDCVGDNWSKPERDLYAWHYIPPTEK
ncbi:hypothetical protein LIA77_11765 [Sarocladium implicatum]|nr:hypothetical protein LIA77_11765 [Sarocladium implicatum]